MTTTYTNPTTGDTISLPSATTWTITITYVGDNYTTQVTRTTDLGAAVAGIAAWAVGPWSAVRITRSDADAIDQAGEIVDVRSGHALFTWTLSGTK
jgi:hypothetical protein